MWWMCVFPISQQILCLRWKATPCCFSHLRANSTALRRPERIRSPFRESVMSVPLSFHSSLWGCCRKGHTDFIVWWVILCSKHYWSPSICFLTLTPKCFYLMRHQTRHLSPSHFPLFLTFLFGPCTFALPPPLLLFQPVFFNLSWCPVIHIISGFSHLPYAGLDSLFTAVPYLLLSSFADKELLIAWKMIRIRATPSHRNWKPFGEAPELGFFLLAL